MNTCGTSQMMYLLKQLKIKYTLRTMLIEKLPHLEEGRFIPAAFVTPRTKLGAPLNFFLKLYATTAMV